jgi:hypothetical protein
MSQLKLSQVRTKGQRYTNTDKIFALSLYYRSPAAYKLLAKSFHLPSKSILSKWLSNRRIETGFDATLIDAIKRKVQCMADRDKACLLLIDEISIKSNLYYNQAVDEIVGFEDW